MKRTTSITMALVALVVIAASIHNHQAAAQIPQTQIKPTTRPALKLPWLAGIALDKTITVGSSVNGDIIATLRLIRSTPSDLAFTLSTQGCLMDEAGILVATSPTRGIIPAGRDQTTFQIRTFTSPNTLSPITCTVRAHYGEETVAADFTVEPLRMVSFTIVPAAGVGPFSATATIALNARPVANQTVTLASSNAAVGFGTVGNTQPNGSATFNNTRSQATVPMVAGTVTQATAATITASLRAQVQTRQVTVRPPF